MNQNNYNNNLIVASGLRITAKFTQAITAPIKKPLPRTELTFF